MGGKTEVRSEIQRGQSVTCRRMDGDTRLSKIFQIDFKPCSSKSQACWHLWHRCTDINIEHFNPFGRIDSNGKIKRLFQRSEHSRVLLKTLQPSFCSKTYKSSPGTFQQKTSMEKFECNYFCDAMPLLAKPSKLMYQNNIMDPSNFIHQH